MKTAKEFTVIGRAMATVAGFDRVYRSSNSRLYCVVRQKVLSRIKSIALRRFHCISIVYPKEFQPIINHCYAKHWVVHSQPSLGNARQVVNYLAKYTHRVAISNTRIKNIDEQGVTFSYKDYRDNANQKLMTLTGVEFLRRFAMHILPRGFVKIRYFGILTSAYREQVKSLKSKPDIVQLTETRQERIVRLAGHNPCKCPRCKTGNMIPVEILPRIRSPGNVFYPRIANLNH